MNLGQAATYAVLTGASVGNTVSAPGAPHTTLRGDLGIKANTEPTGFPPGVVSGTINVGNPAAAQAHADLVEAYNDVAGRTGGTALAGDLAGVTLAPGLHSTAAAVGNTGTVTLDGGGDADAVFVLKIGGALTMAAGARVTLAGGTRASRVFWQVNGAAAVGAGARFAGTLMALDAVAIGAGTQVNGRAMSRNGAISLDANEFYSAPPVVTVAGGATASTNDAAPMISGTTDVAAPGVVTVTVGGQTLTATPANGAWSVTSGLLANGSYAVAAKVVDAAGNASTATQTLTVDTVLPVVALDGLSSVMTNDPTPTIAGTSDVAPGTVVRVSVGSRALTALVQSDGEWNITPTSLDDGSYIVTASVTDPAGNHGTDSQDLTVDTAAPVVTIDGGASALTNDPTPEIAGTVDVAAGATVTLTLPDETLITPVQAGGIWSVTAAALADGPHRVVVSVSDAAGNTAGATQRLTVDTVAPVVAIAGGATSTTEDADPTIHGTSGAAPGTTVTVSIAGQTMTTILQPNGTWNATPAVVGEGTWSVVAEAPDPAGNVGIARQALSITSGVPLAPPATPPVAPPVPPADPTAPVAAPAPPADPVATPPVTTGGGGAVDAAAGALIARDAGQRVRGSSLSIGTRVSAPAGRVVVTATGTVRIRGARKSMALTGAKTTIQAGGSATLRLSPRGPARAAKAAFVKIRTAVGTGRRVTATIAVKVVDAAGNARTAKRTVTLTK